MSPYGAWWFTRCLRLYMSYFSLTIVSEPDTTLSWSLPTNALSPLAETLMDLPATVANKRLTVLLNPLDATLTKTRGGPFRRSDVPTCRRCHVWHSGRSQDIMSAAIPPPGIRRIKSDAPRLA